MINRLKVVKAGDSAGVILPEELLAHLGVIVGDEVAVRETPNDLVLVAPGADANRQTAAAREVAARRSRALRELGD
jgi:antitoxin component of MazEF toxin-antitoxin module